MTPRKAVEVTTPSVRAVKALRPYVASGKVHLAVVPLAVLDHEDQGRSTVAAKAMLSRMPEAMVAAWGGNRLDGPGADARLLANIQAGRYCMDAAGGAAARGNAGGLLVF